MQSRFDQLSNKTLLIICAALLVILMVILFFSYQTTYPQSNSANPSPSLPPRIPNWQTVKQDGFSIQYPPAWRVDNKKLATGGFITIIVPQKPSKDTLEQVEILFKPDATDQDISNLINTLEYVGYTKSAAVFLDKPATKLVKILPKNSFIGPSPYIKDVQKEVYIFLNPKGLYQIDYIYYIDDVSVRPELQKIINSFIDQ